MLPRKILDSMFEMVILFMVHLFLMQSILGQIQTFFYASDFNWNILHCMHMIKSQVSQLIMPCFVPVQKSY